jgi:hypothetical protein
MKNLLLALLLTFSLPVLSDDDPPGGTQGNGGAQQCSNSNAGSMPGPGGGSCKAPEVEAPKQCKTHRC